MAPHEEEDDPAVYRSGTRIKPSAASNGDTKAENNPEENHSTQSPSRKQSGGSPRHVDAEGMDEDGDEDDGTLLTVQPGFNRLLLVLRDEGVMRFVKYISAAAEGSRWDVCGEYEIGAVEEMSE